MGYLTIGGNNLDGRALIDSLSVTIGRPNITDQPTPGTFSVNFYLPVGETITYPITVGTPCTYAVYDSTGTSSKRTVFSGTVSDVAISLEWRNGSGIYNYTITAVDGLAALNNYLVGTSSYAKSYEGTRIVNILNDVTTVYGPGIDTSEIETPGDYEIAIYNSGQTNAASLINEAANSAMGTFYWNQQTKKYKYCTYTTRKTRTAISITGDDILATSFGVTATSNQVCNAAQLTYGTGSAGTLYQDATSIALYGVRAGQRSTTLHNLSDANTVAQILLATRKDADYNPTTMTINTAIISDALRSQLAQVEVGSKITTGALPLNELTYFEGFVESYTWTAARGQDILQMTLSSVSQQYSYTLWNQLNATDTWNTYATATTKWSDLN